VTLQLKKLGYTRVRPLEGGLQAWLDGEYPLDDRFVMAVPSAS
jgi:rhodanese-related sulfurtransferase